MNQPVLGLALGGGVARGWAHIGVIKALEEAGIRADIVAGTSIGSVVGGCHVAGKLETLEGWARGLNRLRILRYMDFKVRHPGLIGGERLARELRANLGNRNIQSLDRPFISIATDLNSGHEVWLRDGNMVEALRASYALPGVFAPRIINGRTLVDGALVNPVPVSVCLAMGASMVIAVNLNADLVGRAKVPGTQFQRAVGFDVMDYVSPPQNGSGNGNGRFGFHSVLGKIFGRGTDLPSVFGVMTSSLGIILDRLTRSRLAGDPPDIHIAPRLGHIGLMEFDRADELIQLGYDATVQALPDIRDARSLLE
jgi:NTE family protein